jgi:hypothetical protein
MSRLREIRRELNNCDKSYRPLEDVQWLIARVEECENAILQIQLSSLYILESKNGRKIKDICDDVMLEWTQTALAEEKK